MADMQNISAYLADRAVVSISGPETRDFLQRVITTDLHAQGDDEILPGALLTPQGKIVVDFLIHPAANGVYLDVDRDAAGS